MHRSAPAPGRTLPIGRAPAAARVGAAVAAVASVLSACGGAAVPPEATGGACAGLLARLPEEVLGEHGRAVEPARGRRTWGNPAVVLDCGLPAPGPTSAPCVEVSGLGWILESDTDPVRFLSAGRSPAVRVTVPASYGRDRATAALVDVAAAVAGLPRSRDVCG